ncbi:cell division protein FtsH [Stieleria sp. TO1_6]|uniref:cell division protein FtsH n=1 Tax=Stieleria tagensis TaxID=2956795 RepID=UPI00209B20CE|nr:cell division protein FtsH [Stieleria tagensis]MCO8122659.1 cell division protein FtsH [Stieleria tagensis]
MNDDPNTKSTAADDPSDRSSLRLMATAYHEAGHAVVALSLGRLIQKVTILPGKSQFGVARLGACEIRKGRSKASKDPVEDEALILLAGMVAEARFTGQYCQQGATADLRTLRRLLHNRASSEGQMERLQRRLLDKTEHLLRDEGHAMAVEMIARELIEKTTISGRAVRHFFAQAEAQTGN